MYKCFEYPILGRKLPTPPGGEHDRKAEPSVSEKGRDVPTVIKNLDLREFRHDNEKFKQLCVRANIEIRKSGRSNVDGMQIRTVSGWNVDYLEKKLSRYEDKQIIQMLKYGFPIECNIVGETESPPPGNHGGAKQFPDEIDVYINKELTKGTLLGPFDTNPFGKFTRFSPMNTRPKKESDDRRIILDLSWPPEGESVNQHINKDRYRGEDVELRLPGVDALLEVIYKKGKACLIFRRDMKSAYKQIPVCLGEIHLLGYIHRDKYYFDLSLPMGLKNSAYICQRVTDMIMYIFRQEGYDGTNYLDDLAAAEVVEIAQQAYQILSDILREAGALEAESKAIPPSTCMLFLGILIDTVLMRLSIDKDRMKLIIRELEQWLYRDTTTLKQCNP